MSDEFKGVKVNPWPESEMRRAGSLGMVRAYPQNAAEWEERCLAYEAAHNRALTRIHTLQSESQSAVEASIAVTSGERIAALEAEVQELMSRVLELEGGR